MTQALLLKRDASALRLDFKMPVNKVVQNQTGRSKESKEELSTLTNASVSISRNTCSLRSNQISCQRGSYKLLGNRKNNKLPSKALSTSNRLELPVFDTKHDTDRAKDRYLSTSYLYYLDKMRSIGLAGVTMPYSRFHYLFTDLENKGVDARARFSQMFEYLKQDKSRNAVKESISAPDSLSIRDCALVNEELFICEHRARNYLFARI